LIPGYNAYVRTTAAITLLFLVSCAIPEPTRPGEILLRIRVQDEQGNPIRGAEVPITWMRYSKSGAGGGGNENYALHTGSQGTCAGRIEQWIPSVADFFSISVRKEGFVDWSKKYPFEPTAPPRVIEEKIILKREP
jgi:hypothetical protein